MGFMDLSVGGSDNAADSASNAVEAFAKQLETEYQEPGNAYNTPGFINVAMIINEMCQDDMWAYNERLQKLAAKCMKKLKKCPEYGQPTASIQLDLQKFIDKK